MQDHLSKLAIHTITTKPWSTEECIRHYAAAGIGGITFWRYNFEDCKPSEAGRLARDAGLEVVSVARGGFFPATTEEARRKAIEENLVAIDEAAEVGSPSLVLVCGAVSRTTAFGIADANSGRDRGASALRCGAQGDPRH